MSQYANRHSIEWELKASLKMEAAEDLYDALKEVLGFDNCCCPHGIGHPLIQSHQAHCLKARAAIAKADGK